VERRQLTGRLTGLGSAFWALMGGAFVSVAIAIYVATFQGNSLPNQWGILLGASGLFGVAGVSWIALSISLEQLEKAVRHVPTSLPPAERSSLRARLRAEFTSRFRLFLWLGVVAGVTSLALLPARVYVW
jgi:hypothetical protein